MTFLRHFRGRHLGVLCVAAGVPALAIPTVHAGSTSEGNKVKISQLPMYDVLETKCEYTYKEAPPSSLQESISTVRQAVWDYLDSIKDTTSSLKDKLQVGKAHTLDFVTYIQEDPSILPKASVITVAGLGGVVAGYRGGFLRKIILSGSAMTAAAALCYPNEAVAMTTQAYDEVYGYARSLWEGDSSSSDSGSAQPVKPASESSQVKVDASLQDHGQSKAEDKDLYTTRGSK
ncbi:MICOS complex subunit MIC27-like [Haliotis rufescens]|uniref:MICOS complex subunit MIC27-like n=1 Tax=Haliotis rufescens TaxID=6454 RepID=UPI00201EC338|nr:MICOS complex subunit MIC27-like [Haliotis rufescens]